MKMLKLTPAVVVAGITLLSAGVIANRGGANTSEPLLQSVTLEQQIQDDVQGALRRNAQAASIEEWNESGFKPSEVFRNVQALRNRQAWTALCKSLQSLSDEDLALFQDELQNATYRRHMTCAKDLSKRISNYWSGSVVSLERSMVQQRLMRGQSADLPVFPLPSEERHIDASRGETLTRGDLRDGEIAITLDDGPHPTRTPRILKILRDNGVRANFFSVGERARQTPQIVERAAAEGHIMGSHSWSHQNLRRLDLRRARMEIEKGRDAVNAASGMQVPFFRFPYGARNEAIAGWVAAEGSSSAHPSGMTSFLWNMDSLDWKIRNPEQLLRNAIRQLDQEKGGIILFHDIHEQTAIALPHFIEELRARGFKTVVFVPH